MSDPRLDNDPTRDDSAPIVYAVVASACTLVIGSLLVLVGTGVLA